MAPFIASRGVRRGFVPLLSSKASRQYGREGMLLGYEHSDEEGLGLGGGEGSACVSMAFAQVHTHVRARTDCMHE